MTEPHRNPSSTPPPEMLSLNCPTCGKHWRDVPMPPNANEVLDAFYAAIPEKFGTCMPGDRHATVAASIPLTPDDLKWLRGISAALAARSNQEATALEGYRAAVSYISADSWDGCSDCMGILRSARSADFEWDWAGNPDKIAGALKSLRKRTPVQAELERATKAIVDELERQGVAYGQVVVEALARAALSHTSSCGGI